MDTVAMWAMGIVVTLLVGVIGFLVKISLDQLKTSFTMLLVRIDKISATLETHNDKLITILTKHEITSSWLDNHEKEIDDLRIECRKLENKMNKHKHK